MKVLYRNQLYDGAIYLAGYVVETALKARICKILNDDYPDGGEVSRSYLTHKFDNLVKLGGLQKALDNESNANVQFKLNWSLVTNSWTEAIRYRPIGTISRLQVQELLDALEDKNDGILTWIHKRW